MINRREAIGAFLGAALGCVGALLGQERRVSAKLTLRPPGALDEEEFLDACVRCLKCVGACPNDCLKVFELSEGPLVAFTPYIKARERGCTLCGDCAEVCPTDALQIFGTTRDEWLENVDMGTARVNKEMCYSYHGRTCGACYRACPLAGEAMKIGVFEKPLVQYEACVGCGLCEQACLHLPQAIRVIPRRT